MQDAVAFFAIRLILGIAATLAGLRRQQVVSPYFRIVMLLVLGLGVLYGLTTPREKWGAVVICGAAFLGSVFWLLERRRAGGLCAAIVAGAAGAELWLAIPSAPGEVSHGLFLASGLASAATLGTAMCGMLLGHRYLTAPGMPLAPLFRTNTLLGVAALFRLVVSAAALVVAGGAVSGPTYLVWLALRWLAGIVGLLVVWYMVRRILAYRNTQSATGVLFVGVILSFIGELTGDLLRRATGVPY